MKKVLQLGLLMIFTAHAASLDNAGSRQVTLNRPGANTTEANTPQGAWLGFDSETLPFTTDEELLEFLRNARVISREGVKDRGDGLDKVLLEKDGVRLHAAFRDGSIRELQLGSSDGPTGSDFRDEYKHEIAAYRLSKLLGLNNVPPVVKRRMFGREGTLQVWVEEAMIDKGQVKKQIAPELGLEWLHQVQSCTASTI